MEKAVPPLVDRAVATELKHLATRENLQLVRVEMQGMRTELKDEIRNMGEKASSLEVKMHKMEKRTIAWKAGAITILAGFIATILAILQTKTPLPPQ